MERKEMKMKVLVIAALAWMALGGTALSEHSARCAPLDFRSDGEFRNVTEPGDVHILSTDKTVLINKRIPEATRVIFGRGTSKHSSVVIVKDCSGTANKFVVTMSGAIDVGEITIDGNYGSVAFRRVGAAWMVQ